MKKVSILLLFMLSSCTINNNSGIVNISHQVPGFFIGDEFVFPMNTITNLRMYEQAKYDEVKDGFDTLVTNLSKEFDRYHTYDDINNLYTLNDSCGKDEYIKVSDNLFDAISIGIDLMKISDGNFNIFMGNLIDAYSPHLSNMDGYVFDDEMLKSYVDAIPGIDNIDDVIELDKDTNSIKLNEFNGNKVIISLGAIAKGYILDKAYSYLKPFGYQCEFDAGSSTLATIGSKPTDVNGKYTISFRSPSLSSQNEVMFSCLLDSDIFISTSGDYEQCYLVDDKLYHHILSPFTGKSNNYYRTVSLISNNKDSLAILDAISTAIFNIEKIEDVEKLLYDVKNIYGIDVYFALATPYESSYEDYNLIVSKKMKECICSTFNLHVKDVTILNDF